MDFWEQPGNQVSEQSVEVSKIMKTEKVMLIKFFDIRNIIYDEFLQKGQMINQLVYKVILRCMLHSVWQKIRELWQNNYGCLIMTMQLLTKPWTYNSSWTRGTSLYLNNIPIHLILHFIIYPKLKGIIKDTTCFEEVEAIKSIIMIELRHIPEESSKQCIEIW